MHGNKTQFERNSSLQYYHVTCIWENKTKLVVGTVRISKLAKPNGDCVTEKSLVTGHSSAIAEHVTSTWTILAFKQAENTHCKIKETLLIRVFKTSRK